MTAFPKLPEMLRPLRQMEKRVARSGGRDPEDENQ